eukprot:gnl/Carplike_NY0171/69_a91_7484.p1 GENE.gnl/Carplike_NY0171/69_a91_7484~~gnl/Carplike_NY0171/69_a91_7484.p1  ORF type:complete len:190 (+),score=68.71 gnl/Carplike_NY0171/69_a91_7484:39-608(+)
MSNVCLFGKWTTKNVVCEDRSLEDYITVAKTGFVPHSSARWASKRFRKAKCPIVERLTNSLMFHGRNTGKKVKAVVIVDHTFQIINLLTGENPIQVLVNAVINSGAREDSTRVGSSGSVRRQSVDVSPLRRVNQALSLLTAGARKAAFRSTKSIAECLANELIQASRSAAGSFAVTKRVEIERVAKSCR